jgi:hypothetical protein
VLGAAALAVAMVAGVVLVSRSGGDDPACLSSLARRVPADVVTLAGTDLARARGAGLDDGGSIEDLFASREATNIPLDPLTEQRVASLDESSEATGYEPGDVRCWVGELERFVARGTFDPDQVAASRAGTSGQTRVDGDLLAHVPEGDPEYLFEATRSPAPLVALVEALDRHGAVSFSAMTASGDPSDPWAAVGLARGSDWDLIAAWGFANVGEAEAGEARVVEALRDTSNLAGIVDGDPSEMVERDGAALWLRAPFAGDPTNWTEPLDTFDAMFHVFADWTGD